MARDSRLIDPPRVFDSPAARRSALLRGGLLVAAVVGATGALYVFVPQATDPQWLRAAVAEFGALAPAVFVAVQALQVIVAPVPGQVLGGVGGLLFGTVRGTAYSIVGVTVGSAVVFALARRYGRPYVERVVTSETLDSFDGFVRREGLLGLFVLFLLPTFPDDALCFLAGLSEIRLRTLLALVVLGRGPTFLVAAYAGGRLAAGQLWLVAVATVATLAVSAVVYRKREAVVRTLRTGGERG